ncbi:boophilin-G2-like [Rhipicephalus sanguineus]|uniref:boophilin-G2-like n=1 Tax=Rhipicephalus sanguineus TaxID=34632 RepID=UPI0020C4E1F1|nr:boophilin-G2-like [Rhipicephalus sanguineus]
MPLQVTAAATVASLDYDYNSGEDNNVVHSGNYSVTAAAHHRSPNNDSGANFGDPERVSDFEGVDFETGCEPAPDSGSCDGELVRWFYNATLKACDIFIYGGCGGNDNNYESQVECKMACKEMCKPGSIC